MHRLDLLAEPRARRARVLALGRPLRRHRDRLRGHAAPPGRRAGPGWRCCGSSSARAPVRARGGAAPPRDAFLRGVAAVARRGARLPGRLPALLGAGGQGSLRGAEEGLLARPRLHALPRRPAPGPSAGLRPHLEHLARPPHPRIRDPEVRRRLRLAQRLLAAAARDRWSARSTSLFEHFPSQAGPPVVHRATCSHGVARIRGMECVAPEQVAEAFYARKIVF